MVMAMVTVMVTVMVCGGDDDMIMVVTMMWK
jgi:hypothetical protein